MSGIYIPDVGLPQDGDFELWISVKKDGSYNYNISGGWNEGKQKAVPVPPHGDLIDRDALCEGRVSNDNVVICAKCAPTIIPAEEGE